MKINVENRLMYQHYLAKNKDTLNFIIEESSNLIYVI